MPEIGLVTVFCPLTRIGSARLVVQIAGELRSVLDCRAKLVEVAGHVTSTFEPDGVIASGGGAVGSEILKTVPRPEMPPASAVP